jgi:radical SAM superfamily enzyme YgiQ (UPF0313 family)
VKIALVAAELEENLSVRYLWGALRKHGHEVVLCRFNRAEDVSLTARELMESKADIAGFSMVFTYRSREFAAVASTARAMGYKGHIIAGGHFAAFNAERLLNDVHSFNSVAIGEGENIICELADRNADPRNIAGLLWRDERESVVKNGPAQPVVDLDLQSPSVRMQPFDEFLGLPVVNILSSRGCMHECDFCSIAAWHKLCGGKRHRFRSVDSVVEEMEELYLQGVRIFNFHDDNFLPAGKRQCMERIKNFRTALERKITGKIAFAIKARPDEVDEEVFTQLRDMGLFRVFLGIEAGTAESLVALGRGQTVNQNELALNIVNKLGLHCCFNLLLFNPSSTLEDVKCNVDFLAKNPVNPMNFCRTEVYAGTPLERKMMMAGLLTGDYWGHNYVIADPRAEGLFQIVFPAFHERCYGSNALHHVTMAVDYENRLLEHFYLRETRLQNKVKRFVAEVNLNTCKYLTEFACSAGNDVFDGRLIGDIRKRLDDDTDRLKKQGFEILLAIRGKAYKYSFHTRAAWGEKARAATVAGLVAAVAIGAAGDDTTKNAKSDSLKKKELLHQLILLEHMSEMAAHPARRMESEPSIVRSWKPIGVHPFNRTSESIETNVSEFKHVVLDSLYWSWIKNYSYRMSHFETTFIINADGTITAIHLHGLNKFDKKTADTSNDKITTAAVADILTKKIGTLSFPAIINSGPIEVLCRFDFNL